MLCKSDALYDRSVIVIFHALGLLILRKTHIDCAAEFCQKSYAVRCNQMKPRIKK